MQGVRYYHKLIETFRTARAAAGAGVPFNRFHSPLGTSQPFIQRDVAATFEGVTNVERFTERVDPKRGRDWMENALHHLDHPETQRVLFDSEQAMVFAELGDLPGPELLRHLHLPFPRTYLELTRPIACETSEPGYLEELAAVLFREIPESERLELVTVKTGDHEAMPVLPAPEGARLVQVTVFLQSYPTLSEEEVDRLKAAAQTAEAAARKVRARPTSTVEEVQTARETVRETLQLLEGGSTHFTDRWWIIDLNSGGAFTRVGNLTGGGAYSASADVSALDPGLDPRQFVMVGAPFGEETSREHFTLAEGGTTRHRGWYERAMAQQTSLLMWMLTFLLAKSVRLVAEPTPRQVRRYHERKGLPLPKPWHVVKVEPTYGSGHPATGAGRAHRYRYDVIGHLRLNRHRTRGGVREVIEWVPPHQRGTGVYIPKTYKVERKGRIPTPVVRRYFGK